MWRSTVKKFIPAFLLKSIKQWIRPSSVISGHYSIIENPDPVALKQQFENAWKNPALPQKQLRLTQKELPKYEQTVPFQALISLMKKIQLKPDASVLEIGCSTGYYSEVLSKAGFQVQYQGCDYSEEFVKTARMLYPNIEFKVEDATRLNYADNEFDMAISGCCLLHIIDYPLAIAEAARVARDYVIFHRTPVIHKRSTIYCKKLGYDIEMLEIIFNEEELLNVFTKNHLAVIGVNTHATHAIPGLDEPVFMKSYLCKKYSTYAILKSWAE